MDRTAQAAERLETACELAEALDEGSVNEWAEFAEEQDLPRGAHAWWEIQTVMAAHRAGQSVVKDERPRKPRPRTNMYESDIDSGDPDGIDPAGFSYAEIHLSKKALETFGGDDLEMRILVGCAVRHGQYEGGRDGAHIVRFGDHSFVLTPDAGAVIGYRRQTSRGGMRRENEKVETVSLEDANFDPEKVEIGYRVIETFGNKHGCDDDEAEEELRDFLADAIEREKVRVAKNGCHIFEADGYTVWVSPDAKKVTKYDTKHIERTPRDVREGVPSRFGKRR